MTFTFAAARVADPDAARVWFVPATAAAAGVDAEGTTTGAAAPGPFDEERARWARAGFTGAADQVVTVPPPDERRSYN